MSSDGTITLGDATGVAFTAGGDNQASMTFTGSLTDLNAALDGLIYRGDLDFHGSDTLTVTIDDLGETGITGATETASDTVDITVAAVNDTPAVTVPGGQTVNEETDLTISGISVDDVDDDLNPNLERQVTLSVNHGTITLGDATVVTITGGGDGQASMTFTGTLTDLNTALDDLIYRGDLDFNGSDTLTVTIDDLGETGIAGATQTASDAVDISVAGVNDTPTVAVPGGQTVNEDTDLTISGISVDDVDDDLDPSLVRQVTLSVSDGTITLGDATGVAFTAGGDGEASLTFVGTLTDLNAALDGLIYRGTLDFHGSDTLTVTIDDLGETGIAGAPRTASDTVDITVAAVNDRPTITVPDAQTVNEDTDLTISGISVDDVDDYLDPNLVRQVTLSVSDGTITLGDATVVSFIAGSDGEASMTFRGTLANLNDAPRIGDVLAPYKLPGRRFRANLRRRPGQFRQPGFRASLIPLFP